MNSSVSVVIPTHNRKDILEKTLESVLNQTVQPKEIIVVDDASSDGTQEWLNSKYPKITTIRNEVSLGGAGARNVGAGKANSKYIAFLDSDDKWLPNHLESKIKLLETLEADGVFGSFFLVSENERKRIDFTVDYLGGGKLHKALFGGQLFDARTSTFVFEKSKFETIQFDTHLKKHQDWDLAINFDQHFKFVADTNPTVELYIEHGEERMSNKPKHDASFYFIEKNKSILNPDELFFFSLKRIMQSHQFKENRDITKKYLNYITPLKKELSTKHKLMFFLLSNNLINLSYLYKSLKMLKVK